MRRPMNDFGEHYRRGLGMSARNNALAYGYSITATASFGMLVHTDGPIGTATPTWSVDGRDER